MKNCKNCNNWVDECLDHIEAGDSQPHVFMGCKIFASDQKPRTAENCDKYSASDDLFTICNTCIITVPKVCVSMGECVNCTDTDLFCLDSCMGEENRKYCTHFVRLHTEGVHLIDQDQIIDIFPVLGMPGQEKSAPGDTKESMSTPGSQEKIQSHKE